MEIEVGQEVQVPNVEFEEYEAAYGSTPVGAYHRIVGKRCVVSDIDSDEPKIMVCLKGERAGCWVHSDFLDFTSNNEDEKSNPTVCKCQISFGCKCGVMESEMAARGLYKNRITGLWEPK